MGSQMNTARLDFLNNASKILFASAPSTSAFLQGQYSARSGTKSSQDEREERICPTCGTILIPGITALELHEKTEKREGRPEKSSSGSEPYQTPITECLRCNSRTKFTTTAPIKDQWVTSTRKNKHKAQQQKASAATLASKSSSKSSISRAKKRRDRGKTKSLQDLVSKSKTQSSKAAETDFGLEFHDLFKEK